MAAALDTFTQAFKCHQAGDLSRAEEGYRETLRRDPRHADAHHLLGVLAFQRGNHELAVASIIQAIGLNPWAAVYHRNLGLAYKAQNQWQLAVKSFQQVVGLTPNDAAAHLDLGDALRKVGRMTEAMTQWQQALHFRPEYPDAHQRLGNASLRQQKYGAAVEHYQQALRLKTGDVEMHSNIGVALAEQGKLDEAMGHWHEALRRTPTHAEAHRNLGNALKTLGRWQEAMGHFEEAVRIRPDFQEARNSLAQLWLLHGDFDRGWPAYEARLKLPGVEQRAFAQPRWDGANFLGRTLLLHAEQGLGDMVQFVRYVPLVKERGGKVIIECYPALLGLFSSLEGSDMAVAKGDVLPTFDLQLPLLSLAGIFRTSLGTIPAKVPYLRADTGLISHWRRKIEMRFSDQGGEPKAAQGWAGHFKIGIVWQGNPNHPGDRRRSVPVNQFASLAKLDGVTLTSLQVGPGAEQLAGISSLLDVVDLGKRFQVGSLADMAAVLMNVDLVITVDTSVAHVAGALGLPVWVALPFVPDWRWLLQREDSPWYPTMRLFRQCRAGEWSEVFERMARAVVANRSAAESACRHPA